MEQREGGRGLCRGVQYVGVIASLTMSHMQYREAGCQVVNFYLPVYCLYLFIYLSIYLFIYLLIFGTQENMIMIKKKKSYKIGEKMYKKEN